MLTFIDFSEDCFIFLRERCRLDWDGQLVVTPQVISWHWHLVWLLINFSCRQFSPRCLLPLYLFFMILQSITHCLACCQGCRLCMLEFLSLFLWFSVNSYYIKAIHPILISRMTRWPMVLLSCSAACGVKWCSAMSGRLVMWHWSVLTFSV